MHRMAQSFQNYGSRDHDMNLTACNLAQTLVCLEDIEGGNFVVVYASVESAIDNRFLQSLKKNTTFNSSLVPCVVDDSHPVET